MIAVDSFGDVATADPALKTRAPRKPRASAVPATRSSGGADARKLDAQTPKNSDPGMGKLSVYVPHDLLKKLTVATAAWDKDKSDIVAQSLKSTLASIVFYDKNAPKPTCDTVEDRQDGAAA